MAACKRLFEYFDEPQYAQWKLNLIKVWSSNRRPNLVQTKAMHYCFCLNKVKHQYCVMQVSSRFAFEIFSMCFTLNLMRTHALIHPSFFRFLRPVSLKFPPTIVLYKQHSFKDGGTTRLCDVRTRASYFCAIALYWIINGKRWHFYSMSVILVHSCDFPQHSKTRHQAKIISAFCSCFSIFLPSCLLLLSCLSNPLTLLMNALIFSPKVPVHVPAALTHLVFRLICP